MSSPVALFGVMTPKTGNFRLHTIVLAKALAQHRPVQIVGENADVASFTPEELHYLGDCPVTLESVENHKDLGQTRLYQLANNSPHKWILEIFTRRQGVVLFHDPSLYWLVRETPFFCDHYLERESGLIEMELATRWVNREKPSPVDNCLSHMIYFNRMVAEYAHGVIVHSAFAADQIRAKVPKKTVVKLPLVFNTLDPAGDIALASHYLTASANRTVPRFGLFGYMAHHKRMADVLSAMSELARTEQFELVLAGKWDRGLLQEAAPQLQALQQSGHAQIIDDYLDRNRMLSMMVDCDFVIGLRYPTAGESSGIAAECNALAVPIVFNPFSGFADIDQSFNIPVPIDAPSYDFSLTLASLCSSGFLTRQDLRRARIATAAEDYARAFERYGRVAAEALAEVESQGLPPSRDLAAVRDQDTESDVAPVKMVTSLGTHAAFRPDIPATRIVETLGLLDEADLVARYETIDIASEPFWHLVFLRQADKTLSGKAADFSRLQILREFIAELKALPMFGRVFARDDAIGEMAQAVDIDAIKSPLIGLIRRAHRLSDREILLRALGLRVERIDGHGMVRMVKRSEVLEGLIVDPARNPALSLTFYGLERDERIRLVESAVAQHRSVSERWWALNASEASGWNDRAALAAKLLGAASAVADLGCGAGMPLERHLTATTRYVPLDIVARDDRTIVVDFNREPLPPTGVKAGACLGLLEYLFDVAVFLEQAARQFEEMAVSYNVTGLQPDVGERRSHAWVNDYSEADLENIFGKTDWKIASRIAVGDGQLLWRLVR